MGLVGQELQLLEAADEEQVRIQENQQHIQHALSGSSPFYPGSPASSFIDL